MAKYIRDYKVTFLVDRNGANKLIYTSINKLNPLHITFSTGYDVGKPESNLELSIYNMSTASRKILQAEDVKVMLQVGTRDTTKEKVTLNTIFIGTISEAISTNTASSDHVTRIKASNGYDMKEIQLSRHIEGQINNLKIIETICKDIETKSGSMIRFDLNYLSEVGNKNETRTKLLSDLKGVHQDGYSYEGTAVMCLGTILKNFNLEYSMKRDGTVKIHKQNHTEALNKFTVNLNNGLLTTPQPVANKGGQANSDPRKAKGYTFKSLIEPRINVNDRIRVDHPSVTIKQDLVVQSIKFSGGYEASHWYSTIKANFEDNEDTTKNIAEYKLSSEQDVDYYKLLTGEAS